MQEAAPRVAGVPSIEDAEIVRRVLGGEIELFELLMRRHNQRVYRTVRSVVRDEAETEDVMQQAYLSAYANLGAFQGSARFSTWLIRIALNEALMRVRRKKLFVALDGGSQEESAALHPPQTTPEQLTAQHELLGFLERAIDGLPELYRTVLILRDIEGLSTRECAEALEVSEEVVKTRLHRAKAALKDRLAEALEPQTPLAFRFHAPRCDRVVGRVMGVLRRG